MAIQSATYKLERPKSVSDSNYEEFEYLLAWYSRSGQYINYLFTDWEYEQNNRNTILNRLDLNKIQTIHSSETREITLAAENVTLNDLLIYASVLSAKKVIRVKKDGTFERVAVKSGSLDYRQTDGRYSFEFDVVLHEKKLPR